VTRARVSAIVVTYKTGRRLKECLYALASDPDIDEIIIVDNGNSTEARDWIDTFSAQRSHVKLSIGHGNVGFGAGVNIGVSIATGPHLLVINPDAVLRRGSVQSLQASASDLAAPWIIGGRIFDVFGREERGPRRRELTLWRATTSLLGWNTWTLERKSAPTETVDMPVISGAFFLTSKDTMAALDGFDEDYFLHVEDVDLCRRCRAMGGRVKYDPNAGALHYGSTSNAPSTKVSKHKADSLSKYFRKFATGWSERTLVSVAMPIMRVAMVLARR